MDEISGIDGGSRNNNSAPRWKSHAGQGQFASIVGQFDHEVTLQGGHGEPHARFDMNVNGDTYEADINVHSLHNPDGSMGGSDVQYAVKDDVVNSEPQDGVHQGGRFSYQDEGLKESDFHTIDGDTLHQNLEHMAEGSDKVEMVGQTYHNNNGTNGIHDIHMNSGEVGNAHNRPGQDGVARFYSKGSDGQIHRESVFIKFQDQHLNGGGVDATG